MQVVVGKKKFPIWLEGQIQKGDEAQELEWGCVVGLESVCRCLWNDFREPLKFYQHESDIIEEDYN